MIEQFYSNLEQVMEGVLPENVYNFDKTAFHDNPKKQKLLFRRSCRNPDRIVNSTKSCFTFMMCGNAAGKLIPPYIIMRGKQKMTKWLEDAPPGCRLNISKSSWIDAAIFKDWFEHLVLPILKSTPGKRSTLEITYLHISPLKL